MRSIDARPLPLVLLGLAGCLSDPELKTCGELPFGTTGCGSPCQVYCETALERCPGSYPSLAECNVACALEPPGGMPIPEGTFGATSGNSLACRVTQAVRGNCGAAGIRDNAVCADATCEAYCTTMLSGGCSNAYPGIEHCLGLCANLEPGDTDADANTVACRLKYARQAANDPTEQTCSAASAGGGGVCGRDPCDVYCALVQANCTGGNEVYPNEAACFDACRLLPPGVFDDWQFNREVDSVECRIYHAGPPAEIAPGAHCPHTRIYNDEHCGIIPNTSPQPEGWPCATFCTLVLRNCPGVFPDQATCLDACDDLPEVTSLPERGGIPSIYPVTGLTCPRR